jgi:hypothetical protein
MLTLKERQWYKFSSVSVKTNADILLSELAEKQRLHYSGIQGDKNRSRVVCKDSDSKNRPYLYIGLEYGDDRSVFFRFEWRMPQVGEPEDRGFPSCERLVNDFFEQLGKQASEVTEVDSAP